MRQNKSYKRDKNAGLPAEAVKASEIEIQQLESQLEMKKFEVEKADEMIKVAKEKVNTLSVMSPADGVIDDIITASNERNGMSGITLRHAGPFKVAGQMSEFELANVKLDKK